MYYKKYKYKTSLLYLTYAVLATIVIYITLQIFSLQRPNGSNIQSVINKTLQQDQHTEVSSAQKPDIYFEITDIKMSDTFADGAPYQISAVLAKQIGVDITELTQISFVMHKSDEPDITITADNAIFNKNAKIIDMVGHVQAKYAGYSFASQSLKIALSTRFIEVIGQVEILNNMAILTGSNLTIDIPKKFVKIAYVKLSSKNGDVRADLAEIQLTKANKMQYIRARNNVQASVNNYVIQSDAALYSDDAQSIKFTQNVNVSSDSDDTNLACNELIYSINSRKITAIRGHARVSIGDGL